jgi:hypothetical protein
MSKKGFSLVSVMIAMGLSAVLIYGVMSLMDQSNKVMKHSQLGADAIDFEYLLEDILKIKAACTATFGKINPSGIIPGYNARDAGGYAPSNTANLIADGTGILNASFQPLFTINQKVIGGYELKEVKIKQQIPDPNNPGSTINNVRELDGTNNKVYMQVDVILDKPGDKNLGGENKIIQFLITAIVENYSANDHRIKECQLTGSQAGTSQFPDYSAGIPIAYGSVYQVPSNGWVSVTMAGAFMNGLGIYVGDTSTPTTLVGVFGDDINTSTKANAIMIPIAKDTFIQVKTIEVGSSFSGVFEILSITFYPAKN